MDRVSKTAEEKAQVTYKFKPIITIPDYSK